MARTALGRGGAAGRPGGWAASTPGGPIGEVRRTTLPERSAAGHPGPYQRSTPCGVPGCGQHDGGHRPPRGQPRHRRPRPAAEQVGAQPADGAARTHASPLEDRRGQHGAGGDRVGGRAAGTVQRPSSSATSSTAIAASTPPAGDGDEPGPGRGRRARANGDRRARRRPRTSLSRSPQQAENGLNPRGLPPGAAEGAARHGVARMGPRRRSGRGQRGWAARRCRR